MTYDPDRMNFDDLDKTDVDAVNAYLDNPVTQASFEDAARAYQRLSAADKIPQLAASLKNWDELTDGLTQALARLDEESPERASLQQLLDRIDNHGEQMLQRLRELRDETKQ